MLSEIGSALASIKTFSDFTGLVLQAKVTDAIREKAIESQAAIISVQTAMLTLQSQYQSLLNEKTELENRLIQNQEWEAEAAKYYLEDLGYGVFVYALNPEIPDTSPDHWLCANCYQQKQKSILIATGQDSKGLIFLCFRCQNSIRTHVLPKNPSP